MYILCAWLFTLDNRLPDQCHLNPKEAGTGMCNFYVFQHLNLLSFRFYQHLSVLKR